MALVHRHGEDGRSADAGRLLEQAFRVHGKRPQAFAEIRLCAEQAFARGVQIDPTFPVWIQLARDARAAGYQRIAIVGTEYHACLAWAAARAVGVGVVGFISVADDPPVDVIGGLAVYSVEGALGAGLSGAVVACANDIPEVGARVESSPGGTKLRLFVPSVASTSRRSQSNSVVKP